MFWVLITLLKVLKELGVTPRLGPLCCSVPAGACERPRTTMLSPEAEAHHVPRRTAYRWAAGSRDRGTAGRTGRTGRTRFRPYGGPFRAGVQ